MTNHEARDDARNDTREALACVLLGVRRIPLDPEWPRHADALAQADAILAWMQAEGYRRHPEPEITAEDLLDTRAGMALARGAWQEGASAMLRSTNEHTEGPWSAPENPYAAPLLAMIAQARVPVGEGVGP